MYCNFFPHIFLQAKPLFPQDLLSSGFFLRIFLLAKSSSTSLSGLSLILIFLKDIWITLVNLLMSLFVLVFQKCTGWVNKTVNYKRYLRNIYISLSDMVLYANFPWGLDILIFAFKVTKKHFCPNWGMWKKCPIFKYKWKYKGKSC